MQNDKFRHAVHLNWCEQRWTDAYIMKPNEMASVHIAYWLTYKFCDVPPKAKVKIEECMKKKKNM